MKLKKVNRIETPSPNPKILIIRFSSIGDIVLTTPVIRCVKKQLRGSKVHYLTKPQFKDLLIANPHLHKIHTLKESIQETIHELKEEKFDYIIDLHNNQRSLLVKKSLKAKSLSFHKQNIEKWLMVNFKINRLKPVHIVDRYMETVKPLGVVNDGNGLDDFIPVREETHRKDLPASHQGEYIAFVIGALHFTKRLPVHKIVEICGQLKTPVVLIGGKEDESRGEEIVKATGTSVFNACGKFSIHQSASLIKKAKLVITNDTGLMHVAAAFQKRIISVWGNTIPEFGMTPYYGEYKNRADIIEIKGLSCRPCSKIGYEKCPKKHFKCMEMIEASDILKAAER